MLKLIYWTFLGGRAGAALLLLRSFIGVGEPFVKPARP